MDAIKLFLFGTTKKRMKVTVQFDSRDFKTETKVTNFNFDLSFSSHISVITKGAFYHLK